MSSKRNLLTRAIKSSTSGNLDSLLRSVPSEMIEAGKFHHGSVLTLNLRDMLANRLVLSRSCNAGTRQGKEENGERLHDGSEYGLSRCWLGLSLVK
jgi:hypothetical protein